MTRVPDARGNVLLLYPVGVLAVVVLACLAVDASVAFLGERELSNAVAAAANDAATEALSNRAFYRRSAVELEASEVARVAEERVRTALGGGRYLDLWVRAQVVPTGGACAWSVRIEAAARVRYVFATAVPGGPKEVRVDAAAVSRPVQESTRC